MKRGLLIAVSVGLLMASSASAGGRYPKDCGAYGVSGHIKAKNVSCHEARNIIGKVYEKSQVEGADPKVHGFDCHAEGYDGGDDILCTKNGGRQAVHYHGAATRSATRVSVKPTCAPQVGGKCEVEPGLIILGARAYARMDRWERWDGIRTVGFGKFRYVRSAGDPPGAGIGPTRAMVVYSDRKICNGRLTYSHIDVSYGGRLQKTWINAPINDPCG